MRTIDSADQEEKGLTGDSQYLSWERMTNAVRTWACNGRKTTIPAASVALELSASTTETRRGSVPSGGIKAHQHSATRQPE
jgi:hypothetical protein